MSEELKTGVAKMENPEILKAFADETVFVTSVMNYVLYAAGWKAAIRTKSAELEKLKEEYKIRVDFIADCQIAIKTLQDEKAQVKKQLEEAEDIILYCSNWIPKNENSEILKRIKQWLSHYRKQG